MNAYIIKNNDISRRIVSSEVDSLYANNVLLFIQNNFADIFQRTETKIGDATYPNPIIKNVNPWTVWGNDQKLASIRLQRDYLLSKSDWTALNDVPLSPQEKTAYENYRQQLRDFPDVVDLDLPIEQIIWPSKP